MAKLKLHRCSWTFVHTDLDACWKVQRALDDQGIEYVIVKGPLRRGKRVEIQEMTGQQQYPVIKFEDGSVYREDSKAMAETIRSGKLDEKRGGAAPAEQQQQQ